uniref:Uncharacterized protein n=1 Tax=virus sp. ctQ5V6 TaxID=2825815 RepID=A0A8S5RQL6_9VIRU|nr:MAG TPA: hypothetical protein [virus sp. ctQ5V6]
MSWLYLIYIFIQSDREYISYSFSILYLCVTLPHNVTLSIKKRHRKESEKPE